jgi:lipopolysaccharide export system protein LptA
MMIRKKIYLLILFYLVMVSNILYAQNISDKKDIIKKNEPIEITSDRMEAFNEKKMVVFSGNATAKQADILLKSDQLLIYYKNEPGKKNKLGTKEIEASGDLDKIEAKGNVVVTQKDRLATSEEASFNQESGQIVMTGNAFLREGKNTVTGCKVIVYTNEDRGSVVPCTPGKGERVKAVIYPQQSNKIKK